MKEALPEDWNVITADFGDRENCRFKLGYAEIIELEKVRGDVGPLVILNRLGSGAWPIEDIAEVIRLALIGGGIKPVEALHLVRTYVRNRPALENLALSYRVLALAINGPLPEEDKGAPAGTVN